MKRILNNVLLLSTLVGLVFAVTVSDLPRYFIVAGWFLALVYGLLSELRMDSLRQLSRLLSKYKKENSDLFTKLIEAEQQPTQLVLLQPGESQVDLFNTKKKEKEKPN